MAPTSCWNSNRNATFSIATNMKQRKTTTLPAQKPENIVFFMMNLLFLFFKNEIIPVSIKTANVQDYLLMNCS